MSKIIFTFNESQITINCKNNELISKICQRFFSIVDIDKSKIYFLYLGKKVNEELTFNQLISEEGKKTKTINFLVKEKIESKTKKKENKNKIKNSINKKNYKINENNNIKYNDYINKINFKFNKNPNLKYKLDITNVINDYIECEIFEVFISYKDCKEYIIIPNINYKLEIFSLLNNKKIISLKGHEDYISSLRYFINKKDYKEYLKSIEKKIRVIIWDITNNYNIKYDIDDIENNLIEDCLLVFPINNNENYFIISEFCISDDYGKTDFFSKMFSLNDGHFIKNIYNNFNYYTIRHLLSWYNKKNDKYYIIYLTSDNIIIYNLLEDELYAELGNHSEANYFGYLYTKDNNDYLCTSIFLEGYINIWDLYNKNIYKSIDTKINKLNYIIEWNTKYIIALDGINKSLKIIDLDTNKVISNLKRRHMKPKFVKKLYHPIYGESLIIVEEDNSLRLWSI